ncbi:MAG: ATP-binding protein [Desulfobacterales bacterium]|nr:ATP-binding protein [Desulfobacterales bacterium]
MKEEGGGGRKTMGGGTISVLLVDDETRFRESFGRLLKGRGFEVILAENGQVALDALARDAVDLILLDLKMPVMGGEEFLRVAWPLYPTIPVIILSGHGTLPIAVDCMKKGAFDFVTKPFEIEELLLTMERAIERRDLERKARAYQEETVRSLLALNTEKKRLETMVNCIPNGIMMTNEKLEIVLHNPGFLRLLGLSGPVGCPVPLSQVIEEASLIEALKRIQRGESPQGELISQEITVGKRVLRAISAPNLELDRRVFWKVSGAVTALDDITVFKELDRVKSDFVNMVAHELRSPLVSIRQLQSVLAEGLAGPLSEKQAEFVKRGIKKIDALLGLINDLLDVARLEGGRLAQRQEPTDVGRVIEEVAALMEPRAKEQGIRLTSTCDHVRPVLADPKNIEEIVNNLLTNAINYSPEGGEVKVSARMAGDFVEIRVSDTGVGIAPEELPKIFQKFYRVKHPRTRQVSGTGLGLSIVKGIVESLQGSIDVESVVEKGTTFRLLIPAMKEET